MAKKQHLTSQNLSQEQPSTTYPSTQRSVGYSSLPSTSKSVSHNLQDSSSYVGGGSFTSYLEDHVARMHQDIFATTRKLELEKRRLCKLDQDLHSAESEYNQKRTRFRESMRSKDDMEHNDLKDQKAVERRVEKAIDDLNKGSNENELLREQIDKLRKERLILNAVFRKLERAIGDNSKALAKSKRAALDEKNICREASLKSATLRKVLDRERKAFQLDCDRMQVEVTEENEVHREQERISRQEQLAPSMAAKTDGRSRSLARRAFMVADEEEAFSESAMHRRILKLSFLNTIQRRHIKQHQKKTEVFEQAFNTIKSSTGISDIEEIVKIFVNLEQRNFSLLTYVNQLNRDIESLEIRNRELQTHLKEHRKARNDSEARKDFSTKDIAQQISTTKEASAQKRKLAQDGEASFSEMRPHIWSVVEYVKEVLPDIVRDLYDLEHHPPPMKASKPEEGEENLLAMLAYIEEGLMLFRICFPQDALQKVLLPMPRATEKSAGFKKPGDLPTAHLTADDSDDDAEMSFGERPLARIELRERAQAIIQRKRKKEKTGSALSGKPSTTEEVPAALNSPASGDETRRKDMLDDSRLLSPAR